MKLKIRHWITLSIVLGVYLFIHFLPDISDLITGLSKGKIERDQTLLQKQVGQHVLYIPRRYDIRHSVSFESKEGFIDTYYPGGIPLPVTKIRDNPTLSDRDIHIQVNDLDQIQEPFKTHGTEKLLKDFMLNVYQNDGLEYGLVHYQLSNDPANADKSKDEFWVEEQDGIPVSFIKCMPDAPRPPCDYYFQEEPFRYSIRFQMSYLPQWKTIRENVLAMMVSFRSPESARAFLSEQNAKAAAGK
jgi:hypothetical protein